MDKEERIKKEVLRLRRIYKNLSDRDYKTSIKLIDNVAFMTVTLEDMIVKINEEQMTTTVVNASQQFVKTNPLIDAYNKMYANFLKGISQLQSLIPTEERNQPDSKDDFVDFIKNKK